MNINSVAIIGNLVREVELKYTNSGKAVVNFSIAVDAGWGDNKKTDFFNCVGWEKTAELIAQFVKKGNKIGVEGRLSQKQWQDKDGNKRSTVEIVIKNCQFLTPKSESTGNESSTGTQVDNQPNFDDLPDDEF